MPSIGKIRGGSNQFDDRLKRGYPQIDRPPRDPACGRSMSSNSFPGLLDVYGLKIACNNLYLRARRTRNHTTTYSYWGVEVLDHSLDGTYSWMVMLFFGLVSTIVAWPIIAQRLPWIPSQNA